jgi:RNA polymerase sigma factor (sigma-70 family)
VSDQADSAAYARMDAFDVDDSYDDFEREVPEGAGEMHAPFPIDERHRRRLVELIELHRGALLKYIKRMLASREDAEDVVQEACIRLLRVRDLWRSEREARAVLYTIATNVARDEMRRRKTRCHGQHHSYETVELVAEHDHIDEVIDRSIVQDVISKTLVRLPQRYREVFTLHVEEHMSYRAIARQLGISTKTVERDLSGVHALCRDRLDPRRSFGV